MSNIHTLLQTSATIKAAAAAQNLSEESFYVKTVTEANASDIRTFIRASIQAGFFDVRQEMINAYDAVHSRRDPKFAKNIEKIALTQTHINQQFVDLQNSPMSGSARVALNGVALTEDAWEGDITEAVGTQFGDYHINYGGRYPAVYNIVGEVSAKEKTTVLINNTGSFFDTSGAAGKYFTLDSGSPDAPHYFWFKATDAGSPSTDPAPGGTGHEVDILLADTAAQIATKLNAIVAALTTLFTSSVATATVTITNFNIGAVTIGNAATSGATVTRVTQGLNSNLNNNYMALTATLASIYANGGSADVLLYFSVDGLGDANVAYTNSQAGWESLICGIKPIQVNIVSGSSPLVVATAIANTIRQSVPTLFEVTEPTSTTAVTQTIGSTLASSAVITVQSQIGNAGAIVPGMAVTSNVAGLVPANTFVLSMSGTSITLNNTIASTNPGVFFSFTYLPIKIYKDEYIATGVDLHITPHPELAGTVSPGGSNYPSVQGLVNTSARGFNMSNCFQAIGANTFDNSRTENPSRIGFLSKVLPAQFTAQPTTLQSVIVPITTVSGGNKITNTSIVLRSGAIASTPQNSDFVTGTGIPVGTTLWQGALANVSSYGVFSGKKISGTRDFAITDHNGFPVTYASYQTYSNAQPTVLNATLASVTLTGDITYNSNVITNMGSVAGLVAGMQVQGPYIPGGTSIPANATLAATTTNGNNVVLMASTAGVVIGMIVTGTGIPASTSVTAISLGSITISNPATATATNNLTFAAIGTTTVALSMPANPLVIGSTGAFNTASAQTLLFGSCTSVATQVQTCSMTSGSPYATIATTTPNLAHLMAVSAGTGFAVGALLLSVETVYSFTTSPANATAGAVYTNNGFSYVVMSTISGGTTLSGSGRGTPQASGTLTLFSGTGDATITFSAQSAASTRITMSANATVTASNAITFAVTTGTSAFIMSGTGIPTGTVIMARAGTTLTLSSIPTATGVQAVTFTPYYPNLQLGNFITQSTTPALAAEQKLTGLSLSICRIRTVSNGDVITQDFEIFEDSLFYPFSLNARNGPDLILSQPATASGTVSAAFTVLSPVPVEAIESLTPPKVGDVLTVTYDVDDGAVPEYHVEQNVPYGGPTWDGSNGTIDTWYLPSYTFTLSGPASVTSGAVYSNNGTQFTVPTSTVSSSSLVGNYVTGSSAPLSSGTLTLVSGTGPATLTYSSTTASSTITMPYKLKGEGVPILCLPHASAGSDSDSFGLYSMVGQQPTGKCYFVSLPGLYKPFGSTLGGFTDAQTSDLNAWTNNSPGNPFSEFRMSACVRSICSLIERFNVGPMWILGNERHPQLSRMLCQSRPDLFRGMFTAEPFDQAFFTVPYTGVGTSFTGWANVGVPIASVTQNGNNVITLASGATNITVGIWNGMSVSGPGIQAGTTVSSFTTGTVTLSLPATLSASNILLFGGGSGTQYKSDFFYEFFSSNDLVSSNPNLVTGNLTSGSNVITGITSTRGILKGMSLTGTGINPSDSPIGCTITSGGFNVTNIAATDIVKIQIGQEMWGGGIFNGGNGIGVLTLQALGPTTVLSVIYTFTIPASSVTAGAVYSHNGFNYTVQSTISGGTTLTAAGSGTPLSSGTLTLVSGTGPATIVFSALGVGTVVMNNSASISNTAASIWFINVVRAVTDTTITMTSPAVASGSGVSIRGRMIAFDTNLFKLLTLNEHKRQEFEVGVMNGVVKFGRSDNLTTVQAWAGAGYQPWSASANGTAGVVQAPTNHIQSATFQFSQGAATQADDGTHPNLWLDASAIPFEVRSQQVSGLGNFAYGISTSNTLAPVSFDNGAGIGVDQGSGVYRNPALSQPFKFWSNGGNTGGNPPYFGRRDQLYTGDATSHNAWKKVQYTSYGADLPNPSSTQLARCTGMTFSRSMSGNTWVYMLNTVQSGDIIAVCIIHATRWALGPKALLTPENPFNDTGNNTVAFGLGTYLLNQFINVTSDAQPSNHANWQQVRNIIKPQI